MRRNDIGAILIIAAFYAVMELVGITCPIRFLTGISCAGCGMSRAWLALLRLDFSSAFAYHPLFWLPVPAAVVLLLRRRIPKSLFRLTLAVIVALFLVVYVIRLLSPEDTVVTFAPSQGLIWRLLRRLWS
ncbi:MAG: DUF2752 domain-containing protein [Oscillospiraceae bacterium]